MSQCLLLSQNELILVQIIEIKAVKNTNKVSTVKHVNLVMIRKWYDMKVMDRSFWTFQDCFVLLPSTDDYMFVRI